MSFLIFLSSLGPKIQSKYPKMSKADIFGYINLQWKTSEKRFKDIKTPEMSNRDAMNKIIIEVLSKL
jgi:hypothetical protein